MTESLNVPKHRTVVTLLHLIIKRLFDRSKLESAQLEHWWALRKVAERIDHNCSLEISEADLITMQAAFDQLRESDPLTHKLMADVKGLIEAAALAGVVSA